MTTSLTAFPSDGYTVRWQRWDLQGDETTMLRWENEGWTVTGEVGGDNVTYVLRLTATWWVRQFLLFRDLDEPDLWLGTDGSGRWGEVNGAHRPDLDGCYDIAMSITPFTNTLPIRRMMLEVGDAAEIITAMVNVETLGVVPVRQRYQQIAPRRYVYTDLESGHETEFDIDEYGLVNDYPDRFRRV